MRALRMQKSHAVATGAHARGLVDQADSGSGKGLERGFNVGHPIGDVVERSTALVEEALDGRIRAGRLNQLDPAATGAYEYDVDTLILDALDRGTLPPRYEFEKWYYGVYRGDRDRYMIQW